MFLSKTQFNMHMFFTRRKYDSKFMVFFDYNML